MTNAHVRVLHDFCDFFSKNWERVLAVFLNFRLCSQTPSVNGFLNYFFNLRREMLSKHRKKSFRCSTLTQPLLHHSRYEFSHEK